MFIVDVAKAGYGKTRKEIKAIAENVAKEKGIIRSKKVTDGWFKRFMNRHPKLSLRKGDATANVRMDCLNLDTMKQYFSLLKDALQEHGVMDSPAQIYNVDETGMPLDHRPPKIVTRKGQKKVRYRTSGNKSQITVIGCISAVGQAIPPFVIFDAKNLNVEWTNGEVPGTTYGLSEKGWVDTELFRGWLVDHFLKHAVATRPLFLLLDGHSSHYQPELIHFAKDHDIVLFCLPPHTTHESQPLDTTVFGPLKQHWRSVCHEYMQSNPGKLVTKYQFSPLLNKAWMLTMTPSNICSGFKKCGIYPFNPNAIKCDLVASSDVNNDGCGGENDDACSASDGDEGDNLPNESEFSADKVELFQRRHEEGYDLYDPEYIRWLELHHPADVQHNHSNLVPKPTSTSNSLIDSFRDVEPLSPLTFSPEGRMPVAPGSSSTGAGLSHAPSPGIDAPSSGMDLPGLSDASLSGMDIPGPSHASSPGPSHASSSEVNLLGPSTAYSSGMDLPGPSHASLSGMDIPGPSHASSPGPSHASSSGVNLLGPSTASSSGMDLPGPSNASSSGMELPGLSCTPPLGTVTPNLTSQSGAGTPTSGTGAPQSSHTPPIGTQTPQSSHTLKTGTETPQSSHTPTSGTATPQSSCTPKSGAGLVETPEQLKYISKYLVQYVPCPPQKKAEAKRVGGARVLTSSECVSILKEHEEKKRIEAELKEKRKIEREKKKKEKEEKAKLKAAEKARKAAERSARLVKKSAPKVRATVSKKRNINEVLSSEPNSASKEHVDEDTSVSRRKKRKTTAKNGDNINPNQCCLCFRTFEEDEMEKTGMEWVECVCKRWLHEDCIDYVTNVDDDGKEMLCPYCCV